MSTPTKKSLNREIEAITEALAKLKARVEHDISLDEMAKMNLRDKVSSLESKLKALRKSAGLPPGLTALEAEADALEAQIDELAPRIKPDPEDK